MYPQEALRNKEEENEKKRSKNKTLNETMRQYFELRDSDNGAATYCF